MLQGEPSPAYEAHSAKRIFQGRGNPCNHESERRAPELAGLTDEISAKIGRVAEK